MHDEDKDKLAQAFADLVTTYQEMLETTAATRDRATKTREVAATVRADVAATRERPHHAYSKLGLRRPPSTPAPL